MITIRLNGGLGNQLFQFAAGRALSLRLGVELGFDARLLGSGHSTYGLQAFRVQGHVLEKSALPPARGDNPLHRAIWRAGLIKPVLFKEKALCYDPAFEGLKDGTYLSGYFQSERYFAPFSKQIRAELTFQEQFIDVPEHLLSAIRSGHSVSLHVRRNDYANDPKALAIHGLRSVDYYRRACSEIADRVSVPIVVYVFSDDLEWVNKNLELKWPVVLVGREFSGTRFQDLYLMSQCRSHIIANSSFSWWGAWLGENETGITVGPKPWFSDVNTRNPDILPQRWLCIEDYHQ